LVCVDHPVVIDINVTIGCNEAHRSSCKTGFTVVIDEPWTEYGSKEKQKVLDNKGNIIFQISKKKHKRNTVGLVLGNDSSVSVNH